MFFQGRGTVYLSELVDGVKQPAKHILCTDTLSFVPKVNTWSHINKCGPNDVEDARGITSSAADISMKLANMEDKVFALGVLGLITGAAAPSTVTNEILPIGIVAGDVWFLGGKERHRAITAFVLSQDGSPLGPDLVLNTDYTLEAATGKVTFLLTPATQPLSAAYGYTDPASVAMLTDAQREWVLDYEYINKQQANKKGSFELFRTRFDPADNIDLQSDAEQNFTLKGSVLADTSRDVDDTEFGLFGRRVL